MLSLRSFQTSTSSSEATVEGDATSPGLGWRIFRGKNQLASLKSCPHYPKFIVVFFSSCFFFFIFKHPIIQLNFSSGLFWGIFLVASSPSFSSGSCEVIVHNATPSYKQLPVGSELKDWNKSFRGSKMWSVGSLFVAVHKNQTRWISHLEPHWKLYKDMSPKKYWKSLVLGLKKPVQIQHQLLHRPLLSEPRENAQPRRWNFIMTIPIDGFTTSSDMENLRILVGENHITQLIGFHCFMLKTI